MNEIEERHLKKTMETLLHGLTEMQAGQQLLTNAVIQCGQRLDKLEKAKAFKPKLIGINGKELAAR